MTMFIKTLAAAAVTVLATGAFAQSAREIRGPSPYVAVENEPAPKLIVDSPLPEGIALGIYWATSNAVTVLQALALRGLLARRRDPYAT